MNLPDGFFLLGLACLSVGDRLKAKVDSPIAWEIGDTMVAVAPYLLGAKAIPGRKAKEKEPPTQSP